jgi:D-alanyl-D-alanine carboxypeptidase/D-alanyl-D-alanine-endopeptidase (penicillin-binding protein 4)
LRFSAGFLPLLLAGGAALATAARPAAVELIWHVERLDGTALDSREADRSINPASLVKLATSLWALEKLGAEHRFATGFGRRENDLFVIGGGDPDFQPENAMEVAAALNRIGVHRIEGDLIVDAAFWIGWEKGETGEVLPAPRRGQLMAGRLRDVFDPGRWTPETRQAWEELARRREWDATAPPRVAIEGRARFAREAHRVEPLLTHRSRPLPETLRRFNAYSNNDIERLEATLGPPGELSGFLARRWKLPAGEIRFATSSGLGSNRFTSRLAVRLLVELRRAAEERDLRIEELLPVAGCDPGTLESFPGLARGEAAGTLVGKTGTLTRTDGGIALLAGFIGTAAGDLAFCVAAPGSGDRLESARRAEERFLLELMRGNGGGRPRSCVHPWPLSGDGIRIDVAGER